MELRARCEEARQDHRSLCALYHRERPVRDDGRTEQKQLAVAVAALADRIAALRPEELGEAVEKLRAIGAELAERGTVLLYIADEFAKLAHVLR